MSKNRGKKGGQERPKKKPQKQPLDRTFGMKNKKGKVAQRTVPVTKKPPPPKKKDNEEDLVSIVMNKYSKPKTEQRRDDFNENIKEEDRKTEKADPFVDLRELKNEERKKNGEKLWKPMYKNTCMYFIQAVEEKKYGWFWECPNDGEKCPYFHKLPEDYVFKVEEVVVELQTLEEIIEERRAKIKDGTPVNEKTFKEWKEKN